MSAYRNNRRQQKGGLVPEGDESVLKFVLDGQTIKEVDVSIVGDARPYGATFLLGKKAQASKERRRVPFNDPQRATFESKWKKIEDLEKAYFDKHKFTIEEGASQWKTLIEANTEAPLESSTNDQDTGDSAAAAHAYTGPLSPSECVSLDTYWLGLLPVPSAKKFVLVNLPRRSCRSRSDKCTLGH